jgi:5-methylthioadenosine/S-adenosylhomocysteine deaminase
MTKGYQDLARTCRDEARGLPGSGSSISRRSLLTRALAASVTMSVSGYASSQRGATPPPSSVTSARKLIRNATIVSRDARIGTVPKADILIEGKNILAIGPGLSASDAEMIEASDMIAMPGFIDTHRHMWQGCLRQLFPNDSLNEYFRDVLGKLGPRYRPDDVYIGNLVSALGAINAGITTILDNSHISNTPEHSDAAIAALRDSGIRAVYGFGAPELGDVPFNQDKRNRYPSDIKRLRKQYFSSEDQLLTLALAANGPSFDPVEFAIMEWKAAREVDARISVHIMGAATLRGLTKLNQMGLLNSKTTYIHCTRLPPATWPLIVQTGGTVSLSPPIEMQMGHGMPAIQESLDHGIAPSLSVDVETSAPNDMFTQMRCAFALQRALVHEREHRGEKALPALLKVSDVLDFVTLVGAKTNGLEQKVGTLTVGKEADVVLLRKSRINVLPLLDPVGAIVLGMDTGNVDSVFVAGRALKRNGKLLNVDLRAIAVRAAASQAFVLGNPPAA